MIKRPCTRNWRTQLRSTTPILMKIGSLVDFELKITYPGLFSPFGPVLGVILGSEGQKWEKVEIIGGTFRHQKTTVEKSLERMKGAKLSKKFAAFEISKKFWVSAALGRFFIFQLFSIFIFLPGIGPPNFFCDGNRSYCPQNIKNPPYGKSLKLRNWSFCQKRDFSVFLIFSKMLSKFAKNFDSIKFLGQFPTFYLFWPYLYLKI